MQHLEENDRDSVEVISSVLDNIQQGVSNWYWAPESVPIV
jgi:hypothetical protein